MSETDRAKSTLKAGAQRPWWDQTGGPSKSAAFEMDTETQQGSPWWEDNNAGGAEADTDDLEISLELPDIDFSDEFAKGPTEAVSEKAGTSDISLSPEEVRDLEEMFGSSTELEIEEPGAPDDMENEPLTLADDLEGALSILKESEGEAAEAEGDGDLIDAVCFKLDELELEFPEGPLSLESADILEAPPLVEPPLEAPPLEAPPLVPPPPLPPLAAPFELETLSNEDVGPLELAQEGPAQAEHAFPPPVQLEVVADVNQLTLSTEEDSLEMQVEAAIDEARPPWMGSGETPKGETDPGHKPLELAEDEDGPIDFVLLEDGGDPLGDMLVVAGEDLSSMDDIPFDVDDFGALLRKAVLDKRRNKKLKVEDIYLSVLADSQGLVYKIKEEMFQAITEGNPGIIRAQSTQKRIVIERKVRKEFTIRRPVWLGGLGAAILLTVLAVPLPTDLGVSMPEGLMPSVIQEPVNALTGWFRVARSSLEKDMAQTRSPGILRSNRNTAVLKLGDGNSQHRAGVHNALGRGPDHGAGKGKSASTLAGLNRTELVPTPRPVAPDSRIHALEDLLSEGEDAMLNYDYKLAVHTYEQALDAIGPSISWDLRVRVWKGARESFLLRAETILKDEYLVQSDCEKSQAYLQRAEALGAETERVRSYLYSARRCFQMRGDARQ